MITKTAPLPVTILGGYLGAGKTTLVNHLLRNANGLKLAVLVNEFGELPIDEDLIEADDGEIISIAGGCVCCSYGNDMMAALIEMAEMTPRPDQVILEASGVAIPGAISDTIGLLDGLATDAIIVLADAETAQKNASNTYIGDTVKSQFAHADIIILNKIDLVDEVKKGSVQTWLREQNPDAVQLAAVKSDLPLSVLLDQQIGQRDPTHAKHQFGLIEEFSVHQKHRTDAEKLAKSLASTDLGLMRAKGFVKDKNGQTQLIQVVARRWQVTKASEDQTTGVVCLGLTGQFNRDTVTEMFASAEIPE